MTRVTIRVLGCGDAFSSGGRFQSCYFVSTPGDRFLIDCGATVLVAMRRFGVEPTAIDTVFLSHLHGDHFGGLPFLLLEAQFVSRRERPLTLAGPVGTRQRLDEALDAWFPGASRLDWRFPLRVVELEPERSRTVGGVEARAYAVEHPAGAPSLALRFRCAGKVLGFSGDTEWTPALVEVARDADLFITECYAWRRTAPHHLDYQTLRAHRHELRAKRLLLTHMSQDMLDHIAEVDCEIAADGLAIEL